MGATERPPVKALAAMLMGRSWLVVGTGERPPVRRGKIKAKTKAAAATVGTTQVNRLIFCGWIFFTVFW